MLSYLVACLIPLLSVSAVIYRVSARSLEESSMEFASAFSSQVASGIDEFMDNYDQLTKLVLLDSRLLEHLDSSQEGNDMLSRIDRQLYLRSVVIKLATIQPDIETVSLFLPDGSLYQFNNEGGEIDRTVLEEQDWLKEIYGWKEILGITALHDRSYYDRKQDGIVLTIGRKIFSQRGKYLGLLLIDVDPSGLISLGNEFLLARNQYNIKISVTDDKQRIFYDSDIASGRLSWSGADQESMLLYQRNAQDYLILRDQSEYSNISVNVVIPKSDLLFKLNHITTLTLLAVVLCCSAVIAISILLSNMIIRPLRSLQIRMEGIEEGKYEVLPELESSDEIGHLVKKYNQMVVKIRTLIEDVYLAQIKQKNAKYLALRTQINPHMLYNTLESIRAKALMCDADEVAEMIKILGRMFRMALGRDGERHEIRDEIDYAANYLRLQNIRFPDSFELIQNVPGEILNTEIIGLVLQPVIENSINHGFRGYGSRLVIELRGGRRANGDVWLQVRDDGRGMSQERVCEINEQLQREEPVSIMEEEQEQTSIGLKNIAERIWLHYGTDYYLRILKSDGTGTTVEILIPGPKTFLEEGMENGVQDSNRG